MTRGLRPAPITRSILFILSFYCHERYIFRIGGNELFLRLNLTITSDARCHFIRSLGWEREMYYRGISLDPPDLLYRSDFLEKPFPVPKGRWPHVPTKTVYGVFNTPLNPVWNTVAPQICEIVKARKICYSAIMAARFLDHGGEDREDTFGPIVIWIATYPTTTTAKDAHEASPHILALLVANGVEGAVVEWYEGATERLSGPELLSVTMNTDPTYDVRRFLTPALGMPIATGETEGTAALFFYENKDKHGAPSAKVFGVSAGHVLHDEHGDSAAPPCRVRLAGSRRFQRGLDDIKDRIVYLRDKACTAVENIEDLEMQPMSDDPDGAVAVAIDAERQRLAKIEQDIRVLEGFYQDIDVHWGDVANRDIGHVDWAPKISVDDSGCMYTKDIGTFELDAARFTAPFKGNVVDLGNKFTRTQLGTMLDPCSTDLSKFKFPAQRQLRINGYLTPDLLAVPHCYDSHGEPGLMVMKNGNTTGLTIGRCAGLEAYLCDDHGVESIELAIYNYDQRSGSFSDKGDSGSLVFDGQGRMVGVIHSGMPRGESNHVTFATPAWWAIEQLKKQYPHAEFDRTAF